MLRRVFLYPATRSAVFSLHALTAPPLFPRPSCRRCPPPAICLAMSISHCAPLSPCIFLFRRRPHLSLPVCALPSTITPSPAPAPFPASLCFFLPPPTLPFFNAAVWVYSLPRSAGASSHPPFFPPLLAVHPHTSARPTLPCGALPRRSDALPPLLVPLDSPVRALFYDTHTHTSWFRCFRGLHPHWPLRPSFRPFLPRRGAAWRAAFFSAAQRRRSPDRRLGPPPPAPPPSPAAPPRPAPPRPHCRGKRQVPLFFAPAEQNSTALPPSRVPLSHGGLQRRNTPPPQETPDVPNANTLHTASTPSYRPTEQTQQRLQQQQLQTTADSQQRIVNRNATALHGVGGFGV